jgi:hypothetical protein
MSDNDDTRKKPEDAKSGQLSFLKIIAFALALLAVGGITFFAGRMSHHNSPSPSALAK